MVDYSFEEYNDASRKRLIEYLIKINQNIVGDANIAECDPALECEKCDNVNVEDCIRVPKSSFVKMLEILQAHGYRINDKFEVID